MIQLWPLDEIAGGETDWLKAKHPFAIGRYGNPAHKPVGKLYVFNHDEVAPKRVLARMAMPMWRSSPACAPGVLSTVTVCIRSRAGTAEETLSKPPEAARPKDGRTQ